MHEAHTRLKCCATSKSLKLNKSLWGSVGKKWHYTEQPLELLNYPDLSQVAYLSSCKFGPYISKIGAKFMYLISDLTDIES